MSLKRTPGGLQNLHLFHKVQYIVYCEGGDPEDSKSSKSCINTNDERFWHAILTSYSENKTFHVKSIGSKKDLKALSEDIESHKIKNTIICLDQDYDHLYEETISRRHEIRTKGYSFENDLFSVEVLRSWYFSYKLPTPESELEFKRLLAHYYAFLKQIKLYCQHDISLLRKRQPGLIPRIRPGSAIDADANVLPSLKIDVLKDKLEKLGYKRGPKKIKDIPSNKIHEYVVGRFLANFIFQTFRFYFKQSDGFNFGYEHFILHTIDKMKATLKANNDLKNHYKPLIEVAVS